MTATTERHVPAAEAAPAHASEPAAVAHALGSDAEHGLAGAEAARRLAAAGPNVLPSRTRPRYALIAARQLADPLVALLLAAAAVSVLVGEGLEAVVIGAIVVLNAVLGLVQEAGAERAVLALRSAIRPTAAAIRDGRERELPAAELVPGDLVVLREGDRVPADGRVAATEMLELDESALTGESVPVEKRLAPVAPDTALADRASMVFAGTGVTRGRGRVLVVATGAGTELGRIAALSASARPPQTPLQRQLGRLSRAMVVLGAVVTTVLAAGMLARGASLEEAFLVGVAVAVAAVPEGLAATVTIALAGGARAMARRGAIVRRLGAVETLGAATVIAADKTGTLTVNQLRVSAVRPEGGRTEEDVLEAAALACTAELVRENGDARVAGDPVDGAFLLALDARGLTDPRLGAEELRELPFDPWRKRLTVVYRDGDTARVLVKGAPEELVARSTLTEAGRRAVLDAARAWAGEGLRVLAVAEHRLPVDAAGGDDVDDELELVGLAGLSDPLRPAAAASIASARQAGLDVKTLTGDHPVTAAAIGRALELPHAEPLTGAALDELGPDEVARALAERSVFARVTPEHKLRLVEALQECGEVVAVTGDGVNDTPALRRADVGVAMGLSGTEAARESADVVLTDDDFATIVAAIREGRRIADNVRNFVAFLLSANLGEVVLFAVAVLGGLGAPMTVVQVLTVNLLTDGLPAVALAADPASPGGAHARPRGLGTLFPRALRVRLAGLGLAVGAAAVAAYELGRAFEPNAAQTMAFATLALSELVVVFSIRTGRAPLHRGARNPLLFAAVLGSLLVLALVVYLPALHGAFGTVSLAPEAAGLVVLLALVPAAAAEVAKTLGRRRRE
jgi:P-type Ca2+ transporter type 2C